MKYAPMANTKRPCIQSEENQSRKAAKKAMKLSRQQGRCNKLAEFELSAA